MRLETARSIITSSNSLNLGLSMFEGYSGPGMNGVMTTGIIADNMINFTKAVANWTWVLGYTNRSADDFLEDIAWMIVEPYENGNIIIS